MVLKVYVKKQKGSQALTETKRTKTLHRVWNEKNKESSQNMVVQSKNEYPIPITKKEEIQ